MQVEYTKYNYQQYWQSPIYDFGQKHLNGGTN